MTQFEERGPIPETANAGIGRALVNGIWDLDASSNHLLRVFPERLDDWHGTMFRGAKDAGMFRSDDNWYFLIHDNGRRERIFGAPSNKIDIRLRKACKRFKQQAGKRPLHSDLSLDERIYVANELFVRILRIHPYQYGNYAVATLAKHTAYKRLRLTLSFPSRGYAPYDDALVEALRRPTHDHLHELARVMADGDGRTPVRIEPLLPRGSGRQPGHTAPQDAIEAAGDGLLP